MEKRLVLAKAFPDETLDSIAIHRPLYVLARNSQTETWQRTPTGPGQNGESLVGGPLRALEYAFVVTRLEQPHAPRKLQTPRSIRQGLMPSNELFPWRVWL
jgi:hypothetical protein